MAHFAFGVLHIDPDALDVEDFGFRASDIARSHGLAPVMGGPGLRSGLIGDVLDEHELTTRPEDCPSSAS